jgi:hypothetical protein
MFSDPVQTLAVVSAVLGLACFVWPTFRRLKSGEAPGGVAAFRSPLWWAGLGFTVLALILLWSAPGAA